MLIITTSLAVNVKFFRDRNNLKNLLIQKTTHQNIEYYEEIDIQQVSTSCNIEIQDNSAYSTVKNEQN